jgi:hypothetical protein
VESLLRARTAPVTAITWQQMLAIASTPDDVISAARDFVAGIDHVLLSKLPPACQPGKLLDAADIQSFAYELASHHCANNDPNAHTVEQLSAFFSQAAVRLSQLSAPNHLTPSARVKFFS